MWYLRFFAFILLAFLPGCSIGPFLTEDAGDYNRAVAAAQDRMILANIVRASQRHPIHFTSIQKISARTTLERGVGFSFPFGGNSTELFGATPSIKLTESPLVEIAVLNSKDFLTGMSAPIRKDVFFHYVDEGWATDFLLYMFVERFELATKGGEKIIANNNVGRSGTEGNVLERRCTALFENVVRELSWDTKRKLSRIRIGQHPAKEKAAGPSLQIPHNVDLSHVISAMDAGYELANKPKGVFEIVAPSETSETILLRAPARATFAFHGSSDPVRGCPDGNFDIVDAPSGTKSERQDSDSLAIAFATLENPAILKQNEVQIVEVVMKLRSPRGMVYFLGEQARPLSQPIKLADDTTLFVAKPMPSNKAAVSVKFADKVWGVPANPEDSGRSMQAISLIHQIVGIEQSREDIRVAPTVLTLSE